MVDNILRLQEINLEMNENINLIEKENVVKVYDQIANDFSETRFCIWNMVKVFLKNKNLTQIGLEIGCGNGKHMEYG